MFFGVRMMPRRAVGSADFALAAWILPSRKRRVRLKTSRPVNSSINVVFSSLGVVIVRENSPRSSSSQDNWMIMGEPTYGDVSRFALMVANLQMGLTLEEVEPQWHQSAPWSNNVFVWRVMELSSGLVCRELIRGHNELQMAWGRERRVPLRGHGRSGQISEARTKSNNCLTSLANSYRFRKTEHPWAKGLITNYLVAV